jgi:hypothetical protein
VVRLPFRFDHFDLANSGSPGGFFVLFRYTNPSGTHRLLYLGVLIVSLLALPAAAFASPEAQEAALVQDFVVHKFPVIAAMGFALPVILLMVGARVMRAEKTGLRSALSAALASHFASGFILFLLTWWLKAPTLVTGAVYFLTETIVISWVLYMTFVRAFVMSVAVFLTECALFGAAFYKLYSTVMSVA